MGSAICGGIMSESQMRKGMKKDVYFGMMAMVLPDKQYKEYYTLKKEGKDKEATKLFNKYAVSQI